MKEKKRDEILDSSITFLTDISEKKYKHIHRKLTNGLFWLQYNVANFIFLLKYRQPKVDLNAGEKLLVFITKRHRKFHLYPQLPYTKVSYLRKNTHLRKDAAFLHFRLKESS